MSKEDDGFPDTLVLKEQLYGTKTFSPMQKMCAALLINAVEDLEEYCKKPKKPENLFYKRIIDHWVIGNSDVHPIPFKIACQILNLTEVSVREAFLAKTANIVATTPKLDTKQTEHEIRDALEHVNGNQSAAARLLGLSRFTLRYRMEKYGL